MISQKYRSVVTLQSRFSKPEVKFVVYLDTYFDSEPEVVTWTKDCTFELEKGKSGQVTLVVRDLHNKIAVRVKRNQIIKYDCFVDGVANTYPFEELYDLISGTNSKGSVYLDLKQVEVECFNLRDLNDD